MTASIDHLPDDVLGLVLLKLLCDVDVRAWKLTCHRFRAVLREPGFLAQYRRAFAAGTLCLRSDCTPLSHVAPLARPFGSYVHYSALLGQALFDRVTVGVTEELLGAGSSTHWQIRSSGRCQTLILSAPWCRQNR
jgi:hypothetical protein